MIHRKHKYISKRYWKDIATPMGKVDELAKNFTMTGWRIGNIIAPDYIIKTIQTINENVVFTAPSISQRTAIPNIHVFSPRGTFYLFVNIKDTGLSSVEVSDILLREAHVLTIPGVAFGQCGEGYVRLACTVNVKTLKEAFDRIEKVSVFQA